MICFIIIVRLSLQNLKSLYSGSIKIGTQKPQVLKSFEGLKYDTFSLSKMPRKVKIKHLQYNETIPQEVDITVFPQNMGTVFKKVKNPATGNINKVPEKVYVAHSFDGCFDKFHFIEKGTDREIGYAKFFNSKNTEKNSRLLDYYENTKFCRNYPGYGLSKDRLIIEMDHNSCEQEYGGIADLIDRLAVEFCYKNGISPKSIISEASFNSHAQHYKRGRRFFKNGNVDINKTVSKRIKENGGKTNTEDLGDVLMYMPKNIIQKYTQEMKKNPILNVY